jgi:hypothetical protein
MLELVWQLLMVLVIGVYLAAVLYRNEAARTGEAVPLGQRVRQTTAVYAVLLPLFGLMQAIRYQRWEIILIFGGVAVVLWGGVYLFTRR